MTEPEAKRQLERVKFLRKLAAVDRERVERLEHRATEMEIEALTALDEKWAEEHSGR